VGQPTDQLVHLAHQFELTIKVPKIEVIRHVKLKAHFLPIISTAKPKPKAPILKVSAAIHGSMWDDSRKTSVTEGGQQTGSAIWDTHLLPGMRSVLHSHVICDLLTRSKFPKVRYLGTKINPRSSRNHIGTRYRSGIGPCPFDQSR